MTSAESTNLGLIVKKMRETKGMSRGKLSAVTGISESYLKKIESGTRQPTIEKYWKIIEALEVDIAMKDMTGTIKGDCTARAQKVFLESTESQAMFLIQILEYIAETMKMIK